MTRLLQFATIVFFVVSALLIGVGFFQTRRPPVDLFQINVRIDRELDLLLLEEQGSILAHVGVIHGGAVSQEQVPFMLWDLMYVRAAHGYTKGTGELVHDQSLIRWGDYLPDLLAGKCRFMMRSEFSQQPTREHMKDLGIFASMICPITNSKGILGGALFLGFPEDKVPVDHDAVMYCVRRTANILSKLISVGEHDLGEFDNGSCQGDKAKRQYKIEK